MPVTPLLLASGQKRGLFTHQAFFGHLLVVSCGPKHLDKKSLSFKAFANLNDCRQWIIFFNFYFFCLFAISWAASAAYGGSQARGRIVAVATGLRQSHSNVGSEPCLRPTPQLMAKPDPQPTEQGQRSNPKPHGS